VDLSGIAAGSTATIKWRGKPVFVKHRTAREINEVTFFATN
jgi:ubiquinol-cytochrome c reductase iron-sulfur subunit